MIDRPEVYTFEDESKIWSHVFDSFKVKVYVPVTKLPEKVINFGFDAPYLLVFEEDELDKDSAKAYADENGFSKVASEHASSVVFVYPTNEGGWENATESLFVELIANSKIHEYHQDGYVILNNRFTKKCDGYAIRGAIYKTCLFGTGKSADYIATNLLKTINGEGLWGPQDVTPTACILKNLNKEPKIERTDIPIIYLSDTESCDFSYICTLKRWVGTLMTEPDFNEMKMNRDYGIAKVKTSKDNEGDDAGSLEHEIGYLAYYNQGILDKGSVPLLLCFHGGGDSAMYIAEVSSWYQVAHDHDFLLICVENHLNSTATEMVELIEHLKDKYNIDESRIYASGFSMGGCKSWDLYQEYPSIFAGLAPMDATYEVGLNVFGHDAPVKINEDVLVPVFYTGGEITPLPELPFQAIKCLDRMKNVLSVNKTVKQNDKSFEDQSDWENPIWGINGDSTKEIYDEERDDILTLHYFVSEDGNCYTVFSSVRGQAHECRHHTCEQAWLFLSQFIRNESGEIEIR